MTVEQENDETYGHNLVPLRLKDSDSENRQSEEGPASGGYFLSIFLFIGFFVSFMLVSKIFLGKHKQIQFQQNEIVVNKKRLEELELKNQQLLRRINELRTPYGQEKIARQKLKLIKPSEKVVVWEESND